jgi:rfaE bifunctional protein nucleotidyltransferase chain/domain
MTVVAFNELAMHLEKLRENYFRFVLTSGAFDILNLGHLRYLEDCRKHGDCLIVGIDSDQLIKMHKGNDRPYYPAAERAELVAGFKPVTCTVIFDDIIELVKIVQPKFFVVSPTTKLNPPDRPELKLVMEQGGQVIYVASRYDGHTTDLISQIANLKTAQNQ